MRKWTPALLGLFALTIPLFVRNTYYLHIAISVAYFTVLATGFRFMVKAGRFSMGHLVFLGIGAYTSALLTTKIGISPWAGFFIGGIAAGLIAMLLGRVVLPLSGIYFAILTLAVAQVFRYVLILGKDVTGGTRGIVNIPGFDLSFLGPWRAPAEEANIAYFYVMLAVSLSAMLMMYRMERSRIGWALDALGQNDQLAEHLGIDQMKFRMVAFGVGAFFAGLTGAFYAHYLHYAGPDDFGVSGNIFLVVYAVVGGLASPMGPLLGSAFVVLLMETLRISKYIQPILYGVLLIVVVMLFPDGLVSLPGRIRLLWNKLLELRMRKLLGSSRHVPNRQLMRPLARAPAELSPPGETARWNPGPLYKIEITSLDRTVGASGASRKEYEAKPIADLELQKLSKYFGGLAAVSTLDLSLLRGEILGLIGPNGAGKTTVFNLVSGVVKPSAGKILFKGRDITNFKPHDVAKSGLVRTFQLTSVFERSTVLKNVMVAFHLRSTIGFWKTILATRSVKGSESGFHAKALELLCFVGLGSLKEELAGNLSHGHRKALGVAMALACEPEALLLDEPLGGMNPLESSSMVGLLERIRDERGTSILLIEHNMRAVMSLCDRIVVMSYGKSIAEGRPQEIRENAAVIQAYLGMDSYVA